MGLEPHASMGAHLCKEVEPVRRHGLGATWMHKSPPLWGGEAKVPSWTQSHMVAWELASVGKQNSRVNTQMLTRSSAGFILL
jgi:hypothetical protein